MSVNSFNTIMISPAIYMYKYQKGVIVFKNRKIKRFRRNPTPNRMKYNESNGSYCQMESHRKTIYQQVKNKYRAIFEIC